ncbi:hypothetical protein Tco_0071714, partial [Tanacetum coccineum]
MTTLADKSLLSGGDNKPPMLEKHLYDSWKNRIELYMMNRHHGRMILSSVEKGPLVWPTVTVNGETRLKEYTELTPAKTIQADCDIKAINIILQGLPTEIYALVSQHRIAKDIWEKIKLLMQGTSLTKQERECLTILVFKHGDDPIDAINHVMSFLSAVMEIKFLYVVGTIRTFTPGASGSKSGKQRIITCYKLQWDALAEAAVQNSNSSTQQGALILFVIEQLKTQVVNCTKINLENKSVNDTLTAELERYKEQIKVLNEGQNVDLKKHLKEKEYLMQMVTLLKNDFKKEESRKHLLWEIALEKRIKQLDNIVFKRDQSAQTVYMLTKPQFFYDHTTKQALGFQNPFYLKKAQQLEPKLYVGDIIEKTNAIVIPDSEETLMLAEEKPTLSSRPTNVEVPKELPKVTHGFYDAVEQHRLESKTFEVKMNQVLNENERLLEQVINKDIVNVIMNSSADIASVNVHECEKCLKLKTELQTDFIEKEIYDKQDNFVSNQSAPSFDQLFELNKLKAQSQEKDTVIKKLKERIKSLSGKMNEDKVKKELEEIETINIELDHRSLGKKFWNSALKDDLRKLKGKDLVENAIMKHTIDPEMLKIDVELITPKLLNKKIAHSAYIKHTQEKATILRDLVKQVKSKYPLDHSLESAC